MELFGKTVLITRPQSQAESLCQTLSALGVVCLRFPTLDLTPLTGWQEKVLAGSTDYAIFISANAVHAFFAQLPSFTLSGVQVIAVGSATAQALATYGVFAHFPSQDFSSHGILQLLALHPLKDQRITILTGAEGSPLLAQALKARGAIVHTAEVYQRSCPVVDIQSELKIWQQSVLWAIVCSSLMGLRNLYQLVGEGEGRIWLLHQQLLVVSAGMAEWADQQGWHCRPWVSENATDAAMVQKLMASI